MLLGLIGIGIWGIAACEYRAIPPVVPSPSLPAQGGVRTPELGKSPLPPPSPTREALTVFPGFGLEQVIGKGILREIAWSSRGSPLIVGTTVSLEGIAPQTGAVIWRQTLPARLKALAISPDGHWLAALVGGDLWLWAHLEENPQRIRVLPRTIDPGFESPTLAFSPDGRQLAWIPSKSEVRRIRLPEGEELEPIPSYEAGWLAFAPDGKTLILVGPTRGEWRRIQDGSLIHQTEWPLPPGEIARTFALSPDGAWLAVGIAKEVYLYSGGEGSLGRQLSISGRGAIRHLIFSPDSRWLAVGTDGGTVQVWEQVGMRFHLRWQSEVSESAIVGLTFDPEGLRLAIASSGGTVEIRRLPEGTQEGRWEGYLEPVLDLAFGKDQLWIATYSQRPIDTPQRIVSLWRVTGHGVQRVQRLNLSAEPMAALSLSPDGRWALAPDPHPTGAAGWGIWRTADGTRTLWIPGGGGGAAFSPDGKILALSDSEGGFRLIRRTDGQIIRHLGWLSEPPLFW